jgi:hypothetical protein
MRNTATYFLLLGYSGSVAGVGGALAQSANPLVGKTGSLDELEVEILRWAARSKGGVLFLTRLNARADLRSGSALAAIAEAAGYRLTEPSANECKPSCSEDFLTNLSVTGIQVLAAPRTAPTDSTRAVSYELIERLHSGKVSSRPLGVSFVHRGSSWVIRDLYLASH